MPAAPKRIFDSEPDTWQELELMVQQAFAEMGYENHRGHELSTVRGKVKIDVYAVKRSTPIPTVILCECKHWAKPVEQSVVYGFRSVCSDIGAHFGLIISKVGFQSGANETREATNIHLLDFIAFQETFFEEWRTGMTMKLAQLGRSVRPRIITDANVFSKYGMLLGFSDYFINSGTLPADFVDPRGDPSIKKLITIHSLREYVNVVVEGDADADKFFGI